MALTNTLLDAFASTHPDTTLATLRRMGTDTEAAEKVMQYLSVHHPERYRFLCGELGLTIFVEEERMAA